MERGSMEKDLLATAHTRKVNPQESRSCAPVGDTPHFKVLIGSLSISC